MRSAPPRVLIYRDRLLPFSETFVLSQTRALVNYEPLLVGRTRVSGVDVSGCEMALAGGSGALGRVRRFQHACGRPPGMLVRQLAGHSPVLIHAHFGPDGLNAWPLSMRLDVPLLVTFHGYDATQLGRLRDGVLAWRYRRRRPLLAQRATRLLAVSEHIRSALIDAGMPPQQISTHYIGVDVASFSPAPLEEREPVVLGVGRFIEKKGFEILIDAMSVVRRELPEAKLVLIGSGPLRDRLERRAQLHPGSFELLGPCRPAEVRAWMRRARVLAVPSVTARSGETEGLPISLVEGLASGLPVVASRHAGIPEAIDDGSSGFLVAERNTSALAGRLLQILTDDARWKHMSAAARLTAERRFDLRAQTTALEEIYAETIQKGRRGTALRSAL